MSKIKTHLLVARNAVGKYFKRKFPLAIKLLGLMIHRAPLQQYRLEIGVHLLKKGCGYQVGQIIAQKRLRPGLFRVKVITGLFYDFQNNKINHTAENRIMKIDEKAR